MAANARWQRLGASSPTSDCARWTIAMAGVTPNRRSGAAVLRRNINSSPAPHSASGSERHSGGAMSRLDPRRSTRTARGQRRRGLPAQHRGEGGSAASGGSARQAAKGGERRDQREKVPLARDPREVHCAAAAASRSGSAPSHAPVCSCARAGSDAAARTRREESAKFAARNGCPRSGERGEQREPGPARQRAEVVRERAARPGEASPSRGGGLEEQVVAVVQESGPELPA